MQAVFSSHYFLWVYSLNFFLCISVNKRSTYVGLREQMVSDKVLSSKSRRNLIQKICVFDLHLRQNKKLECLNFSVESSHWKRDFSFNKCGRFFFKSLLYRCRCLYLWLFSILNAIDMDLHRVHPIKLSLSFLTGALFTSPPIHPRKAGVQTAP